MFFDSHLLAFRWPVTLYCLSNCRATDTMVDTASTMLVPTRAASVDSNMFDTATLRAQIKVEKVEERSGRCQLSIYTVVTPLYLTWPPIPGYGLKMC